MGVHGCGINCRNFIDDNGISYWVLCERCNHDLIIIKALKLKMSFCSYGITATLNELRPFVCLAVVASFVLAYGFFNRISIMSNPKGYGRWVTFKINGKDFRISSVMIGRDVTSIDIIGQIGNKNIEIYTSLIDGSLYGLPPTPNSIGLDAIKISLKKTNDHSDIYYFRKDDKIEIKRKKTTLMDVCD